MIRYEQFLELRRLLDKEHCTASRVANVLGLNIKTVLKWASQPVYPGRRKSPRPSCLDPYKADLVRLLHQHPYSAQQLLQHIRRQGYPGGYSILKEFVRQVRPKANKAYLTLHFPPRGMRSDRLGLCGFVYARSDPPPTELSGPGARL